jgi:hypothetical protein
MSTGHTLFLMAVNAEISIASSRPLRSGAKMEKDYFSGISPLLVSSSTLQMLLSFI